jgi:hypothetical protein
MNFDQYMTPSDLSSLFFFGVDNDRVMAVLD